MISPLSKIFLIVLLVSGVAAIDTYAATWTVTKQEDTNDSICDADCSLREAIGVSANGDTVIFSPFFDGYRAITLGIEIPINTSITITGPGRDLLIVRAFFNFDHEQRIFRIASGTSVRLSDFTISDGCACGWATDLGGVQPIAGAIYNQADNLTLENMLFDNNRAYTLRHPFGDYYMGYGGAIFGGTHISVINSEFTNNFAVSQGSAMFAGIIDITDSHFDGNPGTITVYGGYGEINVNNSSFSNSRTDWSNSCAINGSDPINVYNSTFTNNGSAIVGGGALHVENCTLTNNGEYNYAIRSTGAQSVGVIKNTVIANNLQFGWGGVANYDGTLSVINSTISGNLLGIMNEAGTLFVTNSTISGNSYTYSNGDGAGIYNKLKYNNVGGHVVVTNSTIAGNTATRSGGGIYNCANCSLTMRNSIVGGNFASTGWDVFGSVISEGNNLIGNTTGSTGWIASDLLNVNAALGPLANNGGPTMTHALLNGSPALDAGNSALAVDPLTQMPLTIDQRGFSRFVGNVDIGSYERQATISGVVTYGNSQGGPTPRFVSDVAISGAGSPNVFTMTGANGTYELGGFGSGAYTVTPSKTGGTNGSISSFDSARVAQHAAGVNVLTGDPLIVADVSGNGTISSFDAAQIARYTAGLDNFGSTGNWLFMPANRNYASITGNVKGEDFIALLMGDVSGNWTNQSVGPRLNRPPK